jgi:predicted kinase
VERKRLFGLWGEPRQKSMEGELYSRQSSAMLFECTLPRQAEAVLRGGFTALVDACFLRRSERQRMAALAKQQGVPLMILKLETPLPLIKARIETRQHQGLDPSDATWEVVLQQRQWCEPISAMEQSEAAVLELPEPIDAAAALERIRALIRRQAQQS